MTDTEIGERDAEDCTEHVESQLRRLLAAHTLELHRSAQQAGVSLHHAEALVLHLLRLHGPLTPRELGKRAGIKSSGTLTGAIDRLERAGYTRREPCIDDRRKVFVSLSSAGEAASIDRTTQTLRGLTPDELSTVARLLDDLLEDE